MACNSPLNFSDAFHEDHESLEVMYTYCFVRRFSKFWLKMRCFYFLSSRLRQRDLWQNTEHQRFTHLKKKIFLTIFFDIKGPVVPMCALEKLLLEISQNSQENPCVLETLAQVFSCDFCKISKNTLLYRTSLVAASDIK